MLLFLFACSNTKTVLICGDHICVNKAEAEQFFEENLSLEVKLINKKDDNNFDLVELNLNENLKEKRSISLKKKEQTKKVVRSLSENEINQIKTKIKNKKKLKTIKKEVDNNLIKKKLIPERKKKNKNVVSKNGEKFKDIKKINKEVTDICKIIKKCSIEEISNYLIKNGKKKGFPNIAIRQ